MTSAMFPHQEVAAKRIAIGTPTYLGLDMGLGKSRAFIEAVKMCDAQRVLILCPATAVLVWKREIALWHLDAMPVVVRTQADFAKKARYYIVSHGLMSQMGGPVAECLALGPTYDMTAIDEAHNFNASASNRVKALRRAQPKLGDITPLSGTPMKNHAGDLYTLISICWPQGLLLPNGNPMTRLDYEERFCRVNYRSFGRGPMVRVIEGSKNLETLKHVLAPWMMRVRKEDVFKDLPPILWDTVPIPLDPSLMSDQDLATLNDTVTQTLAHQGMTMTAGSDALTRALQLMGNNISLMSLRRMLGAAKLRGATEYIIDMLDNLSADRKVLVFAHHAHVIGGLARQLGEYSPAVLVGTTSAKDREKAIDKFLHDDQCRIFIGNIQAAGTAITLVGPHCKCSDVVFVESSWTPMDNAQAACRVHRIGQQDGVVARMLSAAGTIDDLVNGLLVRKAREFTQLFDTAEGEKK